jgi:hypothetical protein
MQDRAGVRTVRHMGASSGWNLVARRPPRARVAPKPARHLVSLPCGAHAETGSRPPERGPERPERDVERPR